MIFKKLFSLCFLFTCILLLMMSCGAEEYAEEYIDNNDDSETTSTSDEVTSPDQVAADQASTSEPSSDNGLGNAQSIDNTCILWKPVSEGDHNLVVLLPINYGSPEVFVLDDSGNYVEQGHYVGRTNGDRATYRFSRPGHGYSSTCYLQVGGTIYKVVRSDLRHSC
ncbi:hypothetical protein QUF90_08085 [Desulfococcaceae bacterium HSG9]|nr:hypothetical protein [Desulfococcaceae bacterium HSG9]